MNKPFKGVWFYEWQIGPFVIQVRHRQPADSGARYRLINVWRDPYWQHA